MTKATHSVRMCSRARSHLGVCVRARVHTHTHTHTQTHTHTHTLQCTAVETQNSFGDEQLNVDLISNDIIFRRLKETQFVATASSEETPEETPLGGKGYAVWGMYTYLCTHMHTCIHACMHSYMHTYMHTYTCTHTYIHTYIHIHIYTYIQIGGV